MDTSKKSQLEKMINNNQNSAEIQFFKLAKEEKLNVKNHFLLGENIPLDKFLIKKFKLVDNQPAFNSYDLDFVIDEIKNYWLNKFFIYLSHAEKTPEKIEKWLSKYKINQALKRFLVEEAKAKNFINHDRFLEDFLYWEKQRGIKSIKQILNYLIRCGFSRQQIENQIDSHLFDERESLKRFIVQNKKKILHRIELKGVNHGINYLRQKGFGYQDAKNALDKMSL